MKRIVLVFSVSLISFLAIISFPSCSKKAEKAVLKVNRFELELFSINAENLIEKSNKWDKAFGSFNEVFATQIMQISPLDNKRYYNSLLAFTQDKDMREAYDSTALLFSDFSAIQHDLELAFGSFRMPFHLILSLRSLLFLEVLIMEW